MLKRWAIWVRGFYFFDGLGVDQNFVVEEEFGFEGDPHILISLGFSHQFNISTDLYVDK